MAPKLELPKTDKQTYAKDSFNPINHKIQSAYEVGSGQNYMYQTPSSTLTDVHEVSKPSVQKNGTMGRKLVENSNQHSTKYDLINHRLLKRKPGTSGEGHIR